MDLISIIIPYYNVEKYIDQCLKSVVNQTYKNIEIILIDDGSKDESHIIAESYASSDNRIKLIKQENQGLSMSRNNGVKASTGKYIAFIDSDDYISEDYIEYLYALIKKYKADISCCREIEFTEKSSKTFFCYKSEETLYTDLHKILKDMYSYGVVNTSAWGKLFKREIVEKVPFRKDVIYEDFDIIHLLFKEANRIYCSKETKYYYRKRENSIMTSSFNDKKWSIFDTIQNHKEFLIKNNMENILVEYSFFSLKTLLDIYKSIAFSDYYRKKEALNKTKESISHLKSNAIKSELISNREKILLLLTKLPVWLYKIFILLYAKVRR